jgi:hypothetical protein
MRSQRLLVLGFLGLALYDGAYFIRWWLGASQPRFGDFFAFWSFGRFAATFGSAIYDPFSLAAYQHTLDPALIGGYPYPYPPTFLLALIPLGMMTLPVAYFFWIVSTLSLYVFATLGRNWRSISGLALLAAPTTLVTVISGQNGFLSAALLVGGLRCLTRWPVYGGILLGLLTYKPQFLLLLPIVLIASRNIRALVAAGVTVLFVVLISSAALGWSIWQIWISEFPAYQHLLQANQASLDHMMPTVIAGAHAIGVSASVGYTAQFFCSAVVAVLTWRACKQGIGEQTIAMVAIGTIIVTPYVMIYDMPIIAAAVAIDWKARSEASVPVKSPEVILVAALFTCILAMVNSLLPFAASILIFVLFLVIAGSRDAVLNDGADGVELRIAARRRQHAGG